MARQKRRPKSGRNRVRYCTALGCPKRVVSSGFCGVHYELGRRAAVQNGAMQRTPVEARPAFEWIGDEDFLAKQCEQEKTNV